MTRRSWWRFVILAILVTGAAVLGQDIANMIRDANLIASYKLGVVSFFAAAVWCACKYFREGARFLPQSATGVLGSKVPINRRFR